MWATVNGTPSTACNVGLHSLAPFPIDLVIAGPNLGRNTGRSFVLSSGTIAAATESSYQSIKSIALSFGFKGMNTWNQQDVDNASYIALRTIDHLYNNWPLNIDLFNINIIVGQQLTGEIWKTYLFNDTYGGLYKINELESHMDNTDNQQHVPLIIKSNNEFNTIFPLTNHTTMSFHVDFAADHTKHPEYVGSDLWALMSGHISVTGLSTKNGLYDVDWTLDHSNQPVINTVKSYDNTVKHIISSKMFDIELPGSNGNNSEQKPSAL